MIRILIVDDEADTHLLYKMKFKKIFTDPAQLELISFLNGPDCLLYLKQNPEQQVDLILSDINMPGMNGFELIEKIHEINTRLPVYVVSAYESSDFRSKAAQLGAKHFLSKPVDFHLLSSFIRNDLNL